MLICGQLKALKVLAFKTSFSSAGTFSVCCPVRSLTYSCDAVDSFDFLPGDTSSSIVKCDRVTT